MKAAAGRYAGLIVVAALQFYWYYLPGPLLAKALTAVITAVAVASPQFGFMILAAIAPISTVISLQLGLNPAGGFLLEQLVLAACAGSLLREPAGPPTRLGAPAAVVATVALASAVAMAQASSAGTTPPGLDSGPNTFWMDLLNRHTATSSPVWSPFFAAIVVAESCLLGWLAERAVRRTPALATRLLWLLLAGHAASALLSADQLIRTALQAGGGLGMLGHTLLAARLNPQMEVHAAGSAFVLAGIAGAGLVAGSRARRAGAVFLVCIVAAGLWISGSRLAIIAAVAAGAVALGWWGVRSVKRRGTVAVAATMVVLAVGWFAVVPKTDRYSEMSVSLRTRIMMAKTAVQLFSTAPVFGIGVDQFYGASVRALDPEFPTLSGYKRENAHNNFLQILAEQGVVGLTAMLWWLGLIGAGVWAASKHGGLSRERYALALGLLACVATWIGGHPLLVREFSTIFFFFAAILAAMTPAASVIHSRVAAAAVVLLLISLPIRSIALRNQAWLENQGFGLSRWTRNGEYAYREAGAEFQIYLPTGRAVQLPVRLADGGPATGIVEVHLGGRVVQEQPIGSAQWLLLDIEMPPSAKHYELAKVKVRLNTGADRKGPIMLVRGVITR